MAGSGPHYGRMSQTELLMMRNSLPDNHPMQQVIAPYEHQAFAREYVQGRGWSGVPSMAVAIPAYSLAKLLGVQGARTRPSLAQLVQGYQGVGEGILGLIGR